MEPRQIAISNGLTPVASLAVVYKPGSVRVFHEAQVLFVLLPLDFTLLLVSVRVAAYCCYLFSLACTRV